MKSCYFVSDIHFGRGNAIRKLTAFKTLLKKAKHDGSHLFLLGDIFDYWMEYRSVIPKTFFRELTELDTAVKSGLQVFYICGNHDFALGTFFSKELGIATFQDMIETKLFDKTFLIMHGDKLLPLTIADRLIHSPVRQQLFRLIHPDVGLWIMKRTSSLSGTNPTQAHVIRLVREKASLLAIEREADVVVCGHSHFPEISDLPAGKIYANLGNWTDDTALVGVFNGETFRLIDVNQ